MVYYWSKPRRHEGWLIVAKPLAGQLSSSSMRNAVMKRTLTSLILLFALANQWALAQTTEPAEDFKRATSNQPAREYPQVDSQRRARFRITAPDAQNVR